TPGTMTIAALNNTTALNAGVRTWARVQNIGDGALIIQDLLGANEGYIENVGNPTSTTTIANFPPAFTPVTNGQWGEMRVSNGAFTITDPQGLINEGLLERTGGSFVINDDLVNEGEIETAQELLDPVNGARFDNHTAAYINGVVAMSIVDGIVVLGDFTNNNTYNGNVIVRALTAGTRTVTGGAPFGTLTTQGTVGQVVL